MKFLARNISTCRHQQGKHIGEAGFGVRAVLQIWKLSVLLEEALLHRGLECLYYTVEVRRPQTGQYGGLFGARPVDMIV